MSRRFRTSECDQRPTWVRRLHDVLADAKVGGVIGDELRLTTEGASAAGAAIRRAHLKGRFRPIAVAREQLLSASPEGAG